MSVRNGIKHYSYLGKVGRVALNLVKKYEAQIAQWIECTLHARE